MKFKLGGAKKRSGAVISAFAAEAAAAAAPDPEPEPEPEPKRQKATPATASRAPAAPPQGATSVVTDDPEMARAKRAVESGTDPLAVMELHAKRAAEKEERRKAEVAARKAEEPQELGVDHKYKTDGSRAHHIGHYIPQEDLDAFLAKTGDEAAKKRREAAEASSRLGADNKGAQMMQAMGWTEGAGLGSAGTGRVDPLAAGGQVSGETRGLGAAASVHDPVATDDPFELYKKRMSLGYQSRPNPLGNPRKKYY
mmetsp:Transcript_22952/g.74779  ORF Transcript_22952/g.74779 Transcript_22952/m.74779 type:complete len:254 (+) Transcript_22952:82-843(+)